MTISSSSALREISDKKFLRKAWMEISKKNLRSRGLDNVTIKDFRNNLDRNLANISDDLRQKRFAFSPLRAHAIKKPGSNKSRPLQIATVRDRVVMKALALYIEPSFAKFNQDCSFAFIKGRSVAKAIKKIQELVAQGNKFYFEADIIDFFGTVDRESLWRMFSHEVRHKSLLPLLRRCFELELQDLRGFQSEFQALFFGANSGIPQGGVLSPMLANFYLYHFDSKMLARGYNLVRYADDFVVLCADRESATRAHALSKAILASLGLQIHELASDSKSRIGYFSKDGLEFLGVRFEGPHVFPAKKVVDRFKEKVGEVLKPHSGETLTRTFQRLANLVTAWGKCYKSMRVKDVYLSLDAFIKTSVEAYLRAEGVRLEGPNRGRQMKFLGIPSLVTLVEYQRRQADTKQQSVSAAG